MGEARDNEAYEEEDEKVVDSVRVKANGEAGKKGYVGIHSLGIADFDSQFSGDIKIIRDLKCPDDLAGKEIDAEGDGDVLVVLDLQPDESLFEANRT
ncbi:hypothetical protein Droror1_Dr00027731 [Drosera rotundifolia]